MTNHFYLGVSGFSEKHSRRTNQDRIFPSPQSLPTRLSLPACVAIADGMGGTQHGEQAAHLAVQHIPSFFHPDNPKLISTPAQTITDYFQSLNQQIVENSGGFGVAGSTLSLLWLTDQHITIGHLGDSRIYLYREQKLHLLTHDHNAFGSLLDKGYVPFYPQQCQLSPEDRQYLSEHKLLHKELFYIPTPSLPTPLSSTDLSPQLYDQIEYLHQEQRILPTQSSREKLLWALGKSETLPLSKISPPLPHNIQPQLFPGDLFLLSTDGLHGPLSFATIEQRLQHIASRLQPRDLDLGLLSWGCDALLQDACDNGSDDNISLLLVAVGSSSSAPDHPTQPIAMKNTAPAAPAVVTIHPMPNTPTPPTLPPPSPNQPILASIRPRPNQSSRPSQNRWSQLLPIFRTFFQQYHIIGLYLGICILFVLLMVSWKRASTLVHPKPTPRPISPISSVNPKVGAFFWMPLPSHPQVPFLKRRIHALQQLYQDYHTIRSLWHFTQDERQRMQNTLHHPVLQYDELRRILSRAPLEEHHFSAWDRALQQAMHTLLSLLSPKVERYLDELHWQIPFPPVHPHLSVPLASQRDIRRKLLLRWQQTASTLRWKSWQLALLVERIGDSHHPKSPAVWRKRLLLLRQAYSLLQQQSPQHPLLPQLSNRIQLFQVHLRNLSSPSLRRSRIP